MKDLCILIPSYNSTLCDIEYTLKDIPLEVDVLIIDDGSYPPFSDVIKQSAIINTLKNIDIITNEKNIGIELSLKKGVDFIHKKGKKYIARLDIGDRSPSERYKLQTEYLELNEGTVLIGSWANFVNINGESLFISKLPVFNRSIKNKMYVNNMFVHPGVMMRVKDVIDVGNYRNKYIACEDYDLFFRLCNQGDVHNLPYPLIDYTVDFDSISSKKRNIQVINRIKIIISNFKIFKHGFYPYYGVVRNLLLLIINRNTTMKIRSLFKG